MTPDALSRYQNGRASLHAIAAEERVATRTLRAFLVEQGAPIRPHGRPAGGSGKGQGHRGPNEGTAVKKHRYSCTHECVPGHVTCPTCESCQCTPSQRRTVAKYGGKWLCRCGKLVEP